MSARAARRVARESIWPHRISDRGDVLDMYGRLQWRDGAVRPANREHANLPAGWPWPAGTDGSGRRVVHRWGGCRAPVFESSRADERAVRDGSVQPGARGADVSNGGSGAVSAGRKY